MRVYSVLPVNRVVNRENRVALFTREFIEKTQQIEEFGQESVYMMVYGVLLVKRVVNRENRKALFTREFIEKTQ